MPPGSVPTSGKEPGRACNLRAIAAFSRAISTVRFPISQLWSLLERQRQFSSMR